MFIDLLIFTVLGVLFGIFSGLMPGIHVNTICLLILGMVPVFGAYNISALIISMAISHTFFDFFPSVFLGAPEPSTALGVLPGHRMLLMGRGTDAIYLATGGGIVSVLIILLTIPFFILAIPIFYSTVHIYTPFILLGISLYIILSENTISKIGLSALIYMFSALLGFIILDGALLPSTRALFPVFTGLFGISTLLISLNKHISIPKQTTRPFSIPKKLILKGSLKGIFSGSLVGTLPGVGASQAAILSQEISSGDNREFLVSLGSINTIVAFFSLLSLYTISKARSGAALGVQSVLPVFTVNELLMLISVGAFSAGLSTLLILKTTRKISGIFTGMDYQKTTKMVIIFLIVLTLALTGPIGILVLITSTFIGLLAPLFGVRRSNLMGVLMGPLIVFYLLM